jgi:hypothetical protein
MSCNSFHRIGFQNKELLRSSETIRGLFFSIDRQPTFWLEIYNSYILVLVQYSKLTWTLIPKIVRNKTIRIVGDLFREDQDQVAGQIETYLQD